MKKIASVIALVVLPWVAAAQPVPPSNPEVVAYQQLLTEANDRLAKMVAQTHQLNADLQAARARLSTLEKKPTAEEQKKPAQEDKKK